MMDILDILKLYVISGLIFWLTKHILSSRTKLKSLTVFCETLFCFLTFVLASPVLLLLFCLNQIVRTVLSCYFRLTTGRNPTHPDDFDFGDKIELMNGSDAFWAYDEFANSCNFTSLLVMEGVCNLDKIRALYNERIITKVIDGERFYDVFRKCAIQKFGYYCWQYDTQFDIKNHIRFLDETTAHVPLSELEVFTEIEKLIDNPISPTRPQWEFLLVPHYVYNDPSKAVGGKKYFALIIRTHHSFVDGICGGHILQNGFADSSPALAVDPLKPLRIPVLLKCLIYASVLLIGPRSFFRTLLLEEKNCFHSGKALTGPKRLSWSRAVNLEALKRIRMKTSTTTTAIFVSSIAGALRKLAIKKGRPVPDLVHAFPTIAMLPYKTLKPQNRFTVSLLPTSVGISSPIERLSATVQAFKELERAPDILLSFLTMKLAGLFPCFVTRFISNLAHATILISNIPGPVKQCTVFGGCKWVDMSAWAPIRCGTGVGVGFFSYNGKVRACVVADATCMPYPKDMPSLIEEFEREVIGLCAYAGISKENVFL